jgi:RNA methyltransferase, TrmH family
MEQITSLQNPRVKQLLLLAKARERRIQDLVVVEGAREIGLALDAGYDPEVLYVCPDIYTKSEYPDLIKRIPQKKQFAFSTSIFEKIAYREGSDGLIALIHPRTHPIDLLQLKGNPFVIVLEAVEKPGNLGAVLRTADAAKVDAVVICSPSTDLYNPNTIRSSVGCIFTVPVAVCSSLECLEWMHTRKIKTFAAELNASNWYHESDFRGASAIIMGTESDGLTEFWLKNADHRIKIPMRGAIDSLNVSVSTAVLTFEAMRQRGF